VLFYTYRCTILLLSRCISLMKAPNATKLYIYTTASHIYITRTRRDLIGSDSRRIVYSRAIFRRNENRIPAGHAGQQCLYRSPAAADRAATRVQRISPRAYGPTYVHYGFIASVRRAAVRRAAAYHDAAVCDGRTDGQSLK
jgi:hypothetical protein